MIEKISLNVIDARLGDKPSSFTFPDRQRSRTARMGKSRKAFRLLPVDIFNRCCATFQAARWRPAQVMPNKRVSCFIQRPLRLNDIVGYLIGIETLAQLSQEALGLCPCRN